MSNISPNIVLLAGIKSNKNIYADWLFLVLVELGKGWLVFFRSYIGFYESISSLLKEVVYYFGDTNKNNYL